MRQTAAPLRADSLRVQSADKAAALHGFGFSLPTHHALTLIGMARGDDTTEAKRVMAGFIVGRLVPTCDGRFMLALAALGEHAGVVNAFADATYVLWWTDPKGNLHPWMLRHYVGVDGQVTACEHWRKSPVSHHLVQMYLVLSDAQGHDPPNQRPHTASMPLKGVARLALHDPDEWDQVVADVRLGHTPASLQTTVVAGNLLSAIMTFSAEELGHQRFYQAGAGGRRGED